MSRTRSFSFPRLSALTHDHPHYPSADDDTMGPFWPTHSRNSSEESSTSSPLTPTFSSRGHTRYSSSSSSLATDPDSPANPPKTTLHDLVEDPAERDDQIHHHIHDHIHDHVPSYDVHFDDTTEPLCICDTILCHHREREPLTEFPSVHATPEWSPGDDYFDDGHFPREPRLHRRGSHENMTGSFTTRLSRRISKRFGGRRSTSVSTVNLRSASSSRSSSLRLPATRSFTAPIPQEAHLPTSAPRSRTRASTSERSPSPPRNRAASQATSRPMDIDVAAAGQSPPERQELATTPLLPPVMASYFSDSQEALRSPLTSPTVASSSVVPSMANTPLSSPVCHGFPTPPLSTKASTTSINNLRSSHTLQPASEVPPLAIAEETDYWAIKLGHANFHIYPEPYLPESFDAQHCRQLRDDWEAARVQFMRQAARVGDNYGVTSHTYKLTEEKWAEVDAQWRSNHEYANQKAHEIGEETALQPLAEPPVLKKMPSLQDPTQPSKFPVVEEEDIVGPMVQYAKIQHRRQPSKKSALLRIFTDPAALLGGRPSLGLQR